VYIRCKRQEYVGPRGLVSPSKSISSDLGLCLGLKLDESKCKLCTQHLNRC